MKTASILFTAFSLVANTVFSAVPAHAKGYNYSYCRELYQRAEMYLTRMDMYGANQMLDEMKRAGCPGNVSFK